jgi:hypothetical protein
MALSDSESAVTDLTSIEHELTPLLEPIMGGLLTNTLPRDPSLEAGSAAFPSLFTSIYPSTLLRYLSDMVTAGKDLVREW